MAVKTGLGTCPEETNQLSFLIKMISEKTAIQICHKLK